jgi:hypothetical protein
MQFIVSQINSKNNKYVITDATNLKTAVTDSYDIYHDFKIITFNQPKWGYKNIENILKRHKKYLIPLVSIF